MALDPLSATLDAVGAGINYFAQDQTNRATARNVDATNEANRQLALQTQAFNANQAQIARDQQMAFGREMTTQQEAFQERLSNTAYQRAAADMKAAGLNPILALSHGEASTPSGSTASIGDAPASAQAPRMEAAQFKSPFHAFGDFAERMVNSSVQMKMIDKMSQEIANKQSERMLTEAQTKSEAKKPQLLESETLLNQVEELLKNIGIPGAMNARRTAENLLSVDPEIRRAQDIIGSGAETVGKMLDPVMKGAFSARGLRRLKRYRRGDE